MLLPTIVLCVILSGGQVQDLFNQSDGDILSLLSMPYVRAQLQLSTEQHERIIAIREKRTKEIFDFRRSLGKVDRPQVGLLADGTKQICTEFDKQVLLELDGPQQERLKQLFVQLRTTTDPFTFGLLNDKIAQELKLTDSQRELIKARADAFARTFSNKRKEYEADKQTLIDAAKKRCFEALSPEQQAEYRRLFGEPFLFEEEQAIKAR